jgi:hypothetical protein
VELNWRRRLVDVALEQPEARGEALSGAHAGIGAPEDQRTDLFPELPAVMMTRDRCQVVDLLAREHDDVLSAPTVREAEAGERVLVGELVSTASLNIARNAGTVDGCSFAQARASTRVNACSVFPPCPRAKRRTLSRLWTAVASDRKRPALPRR